MTPLHVERAPHRPNLVFSQHAVTRLLLHDQAALVNRLEAPLLTDVTWQVVIRLLPQFPLCYFTQLVEQSTPQFSSQSGLFDQGVCY